MLEENRTRTWECPWPPAKQVGTAKRKVGVLDGTGNSDQLIVLRRRESRLQGKDNKKGTSGKGLAISHNLQRKHVPH